MSLLPFVKLLPKLLGVVGKVTGLSKVEEAGTILAGSSLSPEKEAELSLALAELESSDFKALLEAENVATRSEDAYVRRARPTGLYAAYFVTVGLAAAMVFGVDLDTGAVATLVLPLFGNAAWYTTQRTNEKLGGKA